MMDLSGLTKTLAGRPVAVFGLARSGLSTVQALCRSGVRVLAWDDNEAARLKAQAMGAQLQQLDAEALAGCACLVLTPGVPLHFPSPHPVVLAARKAGCEIVGDIELFFRAGPVGRTVGITGTNGKSTTTSLMYHVLVQAGYAAEMGGNIGRAVFDLDTLPADGVYVFEMSSFQIDLCPTFRPDIAVLMNITPDHLDRHGTMEGYVASKARLFEGAGLAVIAGADAHSKELMQSLQLRAERKVLDLVLPAGVLDGVERLRGVHNAQNAAAAYTALQALGLTAEQIFEGFRSFPGLPHRQFLVARHGNVAFINDSKATNADAASHALAAYDDIFWIAGGRAKDGGLSGLEKFAPRIRHLYLIGEAAPAFAHWAEAQAIAFTRSGTLAQAVSQAAQDAKIWAQEKKKPATVLLAPACASYDQYDNYEQRGDDFAAHVRSLGGAPC